MDHTRVTRGGRGCRSSSVSSNRSGNAITAGGASSFTTTKTSITSEALGVLRVRRSETPASTGCIGPKSFVPQGIPLCPFPTRLSRPTNECTRGRVFSNSATWTSNRSIPTVMPMAASARSRFV
ncbi:unnamed protein product [Amoebophrya sp. A120]|nr:unnamed protein product [Amoebophrya sp. A120]|eukprot:GSA120T00002771001.1